MDKEDKRKSFVTDPTQKGSSWKFEQNYFHLAEFTSFLNQTIFVLLKNEVTTRAGVLIKLLCKLNDLKWLYGMDTLKFRKTGFFTFDPTQKLNGMKRF